jgi:hypothetical protein
VFPTSINGEVAVDVLLGAPDKGNLRTAIGSALELEGALDLRVQGDVITFRSTLFRIMLSTKLLATVRFGRIQVERQAPGFLLRYHLSLSQLVVVTTIVVPVFFGIPLFGAPNLSLGQATALLCAAWFFIVGGNWFITAERFPQFLRRCVASSRQLPIATDPATSA